MKSRELCLAALSLLLSMAAPVRAGTAGETSAGRQIAEFITARDALLIRPEASFEEYQRLVQETAARIDPRSLALDDLARGTFAGLFDLSPAHEPAAERALEWTAAPTPLGARAAAVRLRLLGNVTLAGAPDPGARDLLVDQLVTHPGFPALLTSPDAGEAIEALIGVGRSATLQRHAAPIAAAARQLDPEQTPERAADLSRLALLLALATREEVALRHVWESLLQFGRRALRRELPAPTRQQVERQVARLEALLHGGAWKKAPGSDREPLAGEEVDALLRRYDEELAQIGSDLRRSVQTGALAGGSLRTRFVLELPSVRTLLPAPPGWSAEIQGQTIETYRAVAADRGERLRAFGGIRLVDPMLRLRAADFGFDQRRSLLFVRRAVLRDDVMELRAGGFEVTDTAMSAEQTRLSVRLGGLPLASLGVGRLSLGPDDRLRARDLTVRLLGQRVIGFGSVTARVESDEESPDGAPRPPEPPEGRSPLFRWLKPPSISIEKGGLTVGYSNALKFDDRWTGIADLSFATTVESTVALGLNYNLLQVTDDTDQFISAPYLQYDSLGSFYYNIRRREPYSENRRLFEPTLFVGAWTGWNVSYPDEDNERNEADVPFSFGLAGGGPISRLLGFRAQASFEQVMDQGAGTDTRFSLTGVLAARSIRVAPGLDLFLRGEGTTRFSSKSTYSWYRGNAGLTLLLIPQIRLSGCYYDSGESGDPQFPYDQVSADHGYTARLDFALGRTRLGLMNRYSSRRDGWVRWQFFIARRVGVAEPYFTYDEQFHRYHLGVGFDVGTILDRLVRRRVTGATAPAR